MYKFFDHFTVEWMLWMFALILFTRGYAFAHHMGLGQSRFEHEGRLQTPSSLVWSWVTSSQYSITSWKVDAFPGGQPAVSGGAVTAC